MEPWGIHHFWGFSPALDLQQIYRTVYGSEIADKDEDAPINMLLIEPGDPRHIIKTIAQRFRHSERPLHFYVYSSQLEVLARIVLLMAVITDWEISARQRSATYLEIFGNATVQAKVEKYINVKRMACIDMLCNERGPVPLNSCLDWSQLKFKERDRLEDIFKSWSTGREFPIQDLWDKRLRQQFGARYDHRENLYDWDYHQTIRMNAGTIHSSQYRTWRNTGVAFEFGDATYPSPNRTLGGIPPTIAKTRLPTSASAAGTAARGGSNTPPLGYYGDMVVSPYHALGTAAYIPVPAEEEVANAVYVVAEKSAIGGEATAHKGNYACTLFDIMNRKAGSEQWRHNTTELAVYNLLAYMHEMETGALYLLRKRNDIYSGDTSATTADPMEAARARARQISRTFSKVRITLLSGDFHDILTKQRLAGKMDVITSSIHSSRYLGLSGFGSLFRDAQPVAGVRYVESDSDDGPRRWKQGASVAASEEPMARPAPAQGWGGSGHGGLLLVESARNLATLKQDDAKEVTRRAIGMCGRLGGMLVGTDRNLSADTFSRGTIWAPRKKESPTEPKTVPVTGALEKKVDLTLPAFAPSLEEMYPSSKYEPGTHAGVLSTMHTSDSKVMRDHKGEVPGWKYCKQDGMSVYTLPIDPLPPVAQALHVDPQTLPPHAPPFDTNTSAVENPLRTRNGQILALYHGASIRGYLRHVGNHDEQEGDNPLLESLCFAVVPGIAPSIASAFEAMELEALEAVKKIREEEEAKKLALQQNKEREEVVEKRSVESIEEKEPSSASTR